MHLQPLFALFCNIMPTRKCLVMPQTNSLMCGVLLLSIVYSQCVVSQSSPTVITSLGTIIGVTEHFRNSDLGVDVDIDVFKGIPFAQPPIGDNRFRLTKPITAAWTEPFNATEFSNVCPQMSTDFDIPNVKSEDCLYLNIWAPNPRPLESAAVLVWIHGGGFVTGYGSNYNCNGRPMVSYNNIVMVTINYRLGAYGFLATGDPELPGNYGLFDQAEALKFIHTHIAAFGGDPDRITIFGESAGAASVGHHMISPITQDYFSQGILQSGSALAPWGLEYSIEKARRDAFQVGSFAGCGDATTGAQLADCLRKVQQTNLTLAQNTVIGLTKNVLPFVPVIDHHFIPDDPVKLLKNGDFKKCKIMLGTCKDEGTLIAAGAFPWLIPLPEQFTPTVHRDKYRQTLEDGYIYAADDKYVVNAVEQQYTDWSVADAPDANYFYHFVDMNTDEAFLCPSDHTARAHARFDLDVWMYQLTYLPSNSVWYDLPHWKGVAHSEDNQYVFGYDFIPELNHTFYNRDEEVRLSKHMMKFWGNFAKTGNPNKETVNDTSTETDPAWLPYKVPGLEYKQFDVDMTNSNALRAQYCSFWNNYIPRLMTFTADMDDLQKEWREDYFQWKYESMPQWTSAFKDYKENTCG